MKLFGNGANTSCTGWTGPEHLDDIVPNLNSCVYSEEQWREMIAVHDILTLICLYLPQDNIWMEKKPEWKAEFVRYGLSLKKLVRGVQKERSKCWDKAKKLCHDALRIEHNLTEEKYAVRKEKLIRKRNAKAKVMKKNIVHGVRLSFYIWPNSFSHLLYFKVFNVWDSNRE